MRRMGSLLSCVPAFLAVLVGLAVLAGLGGVAVLGGLLAVATAPAAGAATLAVIAHATVTLRAPATVDITLPVAVGGKLALSSGTVPPAGTTIIITRTDGRATKTFTVATTSSGTFSLTDGGASSVGSYTYTASYAGSATTTAAAGAATVRVIKFSPGLSLAFNATTSTYGATTVITAHLAKTYTNRTVWIYGQVARHAKELIGHGDVNSDGYFSLSYKAANTSTISAAFTGDARVAAGGVSHLVRIRAAVAESIGGYYGSSETGGITYQLYTTSGTLTTLSSVSPDKRGQCVTLEIEENDNSGAGWYFNSDTSCLALNQSSQLSYPFSLSAASEGTGIMYRIRADYAPTSDTTNLGNDSSWQYFIVY
jgi:hypothetical protein